MVSRQRSVWVTGGAGGLGTAIVQAFAASGYRAVAVDLADIAGEQESIVVDITKPDEIAAAMDQFTAANGPIDVLVNNAGIAGRAGLSLDQDPVDARRVLEVNVVGTLSMSQAFVRQASRADNPAIVNITSIGARQPTLGLGLYEASKAAIEALTRSFALEFAPLGVRVNAVAPGPVGAGMAASLLDDKAGLEEWVTRIPQGRIALPGDVTPAVQFLASTAADHITGQVLSVDGGRLLA